MRVRWHLEGEMQSLKRRCLLFAVKRTLGGVRGKTPAGSRGCVGDSGPLSPALLSQNQSRS